MIHPQHDEIRRLIENWAAWTGDHKGAVYATNPIAWTNEAYARLEASRSRVNVIKPIGAEAQLTGEALADIDGREGMALKAYHLSSLPRVQLAREYLRCGVRTFECLVLRAHSSFWEAYRKRVDRARELEVQQKAAAASAPSTPRRLSPPRC